MPASAQRVHCDSGAIQVRVGPTAARWDRARASALPGARGRPSRGGGGSFEPFEST